MKPQVSLVALLSTLFIFNVVCAEDEPLDHTILALAEPGGWVMTHDDVTLIVSVPEKGELVYFDTLKEEERKRVAVDFQPTALALQGDTLFAAAKGSSVVYALDAETGKAKKELFTGSEAVAHLTCHPHGGLVYASNLKFEVYSIDPKSGKSTKTQGQGFFLAIDPIRGEFLYAGIQPRDRDEIVFKGDRDGSLRLIFDRWGKRSVLMKYQIRGGDLKLVSGQNNAAVNGRWMHLTPDGKRIMIMGGGGWRPKDEGAGGGYITPIFNTSNLQARMGQVESKMNVVFHPVLDLAIVNNYGRTLIPVKKKSLVVGKSIVVRPGEVDRRISLLTFGAKGSKVILWNGPSLEAKRGLNFIPLDLTEADRQALAKADAERGMRPPPVVASKEPNKEPMLRTWSDSTGQFSVKATFVALTGDKVKLKRENGSTINVPVSRLSKDDQKYLQGLR